jgi:hypothetical protein
MVYLLSSDSNQEELLTTCKVVGVVHLGGNKPFDVQGHGQLTRYLTCTYGF